MEAKIIGNVFKVVAKFMCQNSIVLYHLTLANGTNGIVTVAFFENILRKYNIEYEDRSSILRVNVVDAGNGGYILKRDSNTQEAILKYGKFLSIRPTGVSFEVALEGLITNTLRQMNNVDILRKWVNRNRFIKILAKTQDKQDFPFLYLCVTKPDSVDIDIDEDSYLDLRYTFGYYITAEELPMFGLKEQEIKIVGYGYYWSGDDGFDPVRWRAVVETGGWYIEELVSRGKIRLFNVSSIDIEGYISIKRLSNRVFSVLPKKVAESVGYREPRYGYQDILNIGTQQIMLSAEAQLRHFEIVNKSILDDCMKDESGYYAYKAAYERGYIPHPKIYYTDSTIYVSVSRALGQSEGLSYTQKSIPKDPRNETLGRKLASFVRKKLNL